ncbi:MAG: hypothetical protein PVF97_03110 [Desulfobacterales bacterium]|jgi:hypothetical protein
MLKLIDRIPVSLLLALAVILLLAPVAPVPHVWEKLVMLLRGELRRPLDVFDLIYHLLPTVLLIVRLVRLRRRPTPSGE